MKDIYEKDFEYYENQAAYFDYTHDPYDYDCGLRKLRSEEHRIESRRSQNDLWSS